LVLVLVVLGLLGIPPWTGGAHATTVASALLGPTTESSVAGNVVPLTLSLNSTAIDLSNDFWGTTVSPRAQLLPNEVDLVNATQTQLIVWPGAGAGDTYDPIANVLHGDGGAALGPPTTSEAQFVRWCKSISCRAIFQVPGEIDDPALAASILTYTEVNLSYRPAYWEIGNEPQEWKHFALPWSTWSLRTVRPTPMQYALEVATYISAMQSANAATPFRALPPQIIGIPAAARSDPLDPLTTWINDTVEVNGPQIAAVAFHEYPAAGNKFSNVSLPSFYASLTQAGGLPDRLQSVEQAIHASAQQYCPTTCSSIPVFVTEIGTALSHKPYGRVFSGGFPGALAMSAEIVQAMALNVSNADIFGGVFNTTNSWLTLQGAPRPVYLAYTQVFNHLGPVAFAVNLSANNANFSSTVFGISTLAPNDRDRGDLMMVNTNVTSTASFQPLIPDYLAGSPVEAWYWNGSVVNGTAVAQTVAPMAEFFPQGLPSSWNLPPQSLIVFEGYHGAAAPVSFRETGLPAGTTWFLRTGTSSSFNATNSSNLTVFAPLGPMFPEALPAYTPGLGNSSRFLADDLPGLSVPPEGTSATVRFVQQWKVSIVSSSDVAGVVTPTPTWANANAPLELSARPAFGYAISDWVGSEQLGDGVNILHPSSGTLVANGTTFTNVTAATTWTSLSNVTGAAPITTVWPNGSLSERAVFAPAYPVTFNEFGLPRGTPWSVTVRSNWNDTLSVTHYLQVKTATDPNGTWLNSSAVTTRPAVINTTANSMMNAIIVAEANRTYGFSVNPVGGYRSRPVGAEFTVQGGRVVITVNFTPTTPPAPQYPVTFLASGLPNGTPWSITVRNVTGSSTTSTLVLEESNGSYGYVAATVAGFHPHPPAFGFVVNGSATVVPVGFAAVRYNVVWEESGLGPNLSWTVSVSGQTYGSAGAWTTAPLTNGSYTYSISNVRDYIPVVNRSGGFRVNGTEIHCPVLFVRAAFPVMFMVSGIPENDPWSVRFSNLTFSVVELWARFVEPNGSYTFNVTPPSGFAATPSHGVITVDAAPTVLPIAFVVLGPPSDPPIWNLVIPALVAASVIGLAGWGTFALVGATTRRRPGAKP